MNHLASNGIPEHNPPLSDGQAFEDRVTLAVVDALVGTASYWVRGVSIRVDPDARHVLVMFATAETNIEITGSVAAFSARLGRATSSWLRHDTEHWVGPELGFWPGRHDRLVYATRVPPIDGMTPQLEYENAVALTLSEALCGALGPEMWGATFTADARTRDVRLYLSFHRPLTRHDRYELDELVTLVDSWMWDSDFRIHIHVGDVDDPQREWAGEGHRRLYRQRWPSSLLPDDFSSEEFEVIDFAGNPVEHDPGDHEN